MLAVHGQQLDALTGRRGHDQFSTRHQGLFIGQSDVVPGFDRGQGRKQPYHAHDGIEDQIRFFQCRQFAQAVHPRQNADRQIPGAHPQRCSGLFIEYSGGLGAKAADLVFQQPVVRTGRQGGYRISKPVHYLERLGADGTGRAEDHQTLRTDDLVLRNVHMTFLMISPQRAGFTLYAPFKTGRPEGHTEPGYRARAERTSGCRTGP